MSHEYHFTPSPLNAALMLEQPAADYSKKILSA
jgi:hypothetical protein